MNEKHKFTDVLEESYYEKAVSWVAANDIVLGTSENSFSPNKELTREQLATILYRYANYVKMSVENEKNVNIYEYDDANEISEYTVSAVEWACNNSIITGRAASTIAPKDTATRAEVATILMRLNKK